MKIKQFASVFAASVVLPTSFSMLLLSVVFSPKPANAGIGDVLCNLFCPEPQSIPAANEKPQPKYKASIELPDMDEFQETDVDCGPHSAARVLRWLGYDQGGDIYGTLQRTRTSGLDGIPLATGLGTTPQYLAELIGIMTGERGKVHIERGAYFSRLKEILMSGKPVIALVRIGTAGNDSWYKPTYPLLHWIVVTGFDDNTKEVYFKNIGNNYSYSVPYSSFLASTAGASDFTWTWRVGRGGPAAALEGAGATSSTFLWIDQFPGLNDEVDQGRFGETNGGGKVDYGNGSVPAFNLEFRA